MTPSDHLEYAVPRIPASAAALIHDPRGRLLILKPTYKTGWTLPGGQMDPGESPWGACRREAQEECGIELRRGRLACVDFLPPRPKKPGGVRFLFDCGSLDERDLQIVVDGFEIAQHRFAELEEALELLSGPLRRRVRAVGGISHCVYLENGERLGDVT